MKAYTDIKQSVQLSLLLPVESADMKYPYLGDGQYGTTPYIGEPIEFSGDKDIPCWSLAALFDVLPSKIEDAYCCHQLEIDMITKMPKYRLYGGNSYSNSFPWNFEKEDLLDNVVESIIWLKENNLL